MSSNNKLSPQQRKRLGYLLLIVGTAYMGYCIFVTWRKDSEMTILPGLFLVLFSSRFLMKKKE
ncbi:MAG: hypothetical protein ACK5B6_10140 [Bacteroidia bacterium]|jgi:hypothetical protein